MSWTLSQRFQRIVLLDVAAAPVGKTAANAEFERGDLLDADQLDALFAKVRPTCVIHLASLLSGSCEQDRTRGWRVNMDGSFALLEAALRHNRPTVLFASSLAAYGGRLPDVLTDDTPQWPESLYGVTKMAIERLGAYYHRRHGLDFRCLRLPIIVSRFAPAGAASALASRAFIEAAHQGKFTFRAPAGTRLALLYVYDVLRAFAGLLAAPSNQLSSRVYNIAAMTVTAREIAEAIQRRLPRAALHFEPDATVAALLASWPSGIDDQSARRDWDWLPEFNLEQMADDFLGRLKEESP